VIGPSGDRAIGSSAIEHDPQPGTAARTQTSIIPDLPLVRRVRSPIARLPDRQSTDHPIVDHRSSMN
jgi:hypothetical protein